MNVPYAEYIVFGLVLATSVAVTYVFTKRKYQLRVTAKNGDVKSWGAVALKSVPKPATEEVAEVKKPNHWKLEVNGTAKFDIKVEWSDGDVMIFSGQAPESYEVDQEKGVVPINTAGIPPEWADDGISYQWNLNDNLWC